jgi:hypothetical protein
MNASERINESQKAQTQFLSEQEQKDFEAWKDRKVYTGSKPYETNGRHS